MKTVKQLLRRRGARSIRSAPTRRSIEALESMAEKDVGALVVTEGARLVGIISERDYARKVILQGKWSQDVPVREIMTEDVVTVDPSRTVEDCMALVTEHRVRHLPVCDGDRLVGHHLDRRPGEGSDRRAGGDDQAARVLHPFLSAGRESHAPRASAGNLAQRVLRASCHGHKMKFGAIIIGDEILCGKRQDKHMPKLIEMMGARGLELAWCQYLGDDPELITATLERTFGSGDVVFSFGGIGATPDDHTRACAARAAGVELRLHPDAEAEIRDAFRQPTSRRAASRWGSFPSGSEIIPNPHNRIPGFSLKEHHFVPGFPQMAWPMIAWVLDRRYAHLSRPGSHRRTLDHRARRRREPAHRPDERCLARYPQLKVFSLPRMEPERHVELGVRGEASVVPVAIRYLQDGVAGSDFTGATPVVTPDIKKPRLAAGVFVRRGERLRYSSWLSSPLRSSDLRRLRCCSGSTSPNCFATFVRLSKPEFTAASVDFMAAMPTSDPPGPFHDLVQRRDHLLVELGNLLFDELADFGLGSGGNVVDLFRVGGRLFDRRLDDGVLQRGELVEITYGGERAGVLHAVGQS